jgi:hypothetical protein
MMLQPWLPDWRNKSGYPDPEKTTGRQWAWEFLRRNPEYQRLYAEYDNLSTKRPLVEHPAGYEYLMRNSPVILLPGALIENQAYCEDLVNEATIDYFREFKSDEAYRQGDLIRQEILIKFGVRVLLNADLLAPDCTNIEHLAFQNDFYPPYIVYRDLPLSQGLYSTNEGESFSGYLVPIVPRKEGEITIKFDPNYSIESQLKSVEKVLLEKWGKITHRIRADVYVLYLRILDALASGVDKSEIKSVIYPYLNDEYPGNEATKKLYQQQKEAEILRDKDYIDLIHK